MVGVDIRADYFGIDTNIMPSFWRRTWVPIRV
jgi:hypothetical protein